MVNPGGTGRPRLVISARFAPLPPRSSFMSLLPSAKSYTSFGTVTPWGAGGCSQAREGDPLAHRHRRRGLGFRVSQKTSPVEHWSHYADVTLPTTRRPENPYSVDNARQSSGFPPKRRRRALPAFSTDNTLLPRLLQ